MSLWGSLQKGVASLESRLDTILGETEDVPQPTKPDPVTHITSPALEAVDAQARKQNNSSPANDRLQARLAKAIAAKNHVVNSASISKTATPRHSIDAPRPSFDSTRAASQDVPVENTTITTPSSETNKVSKEESVESVEQTDRRPDGEFVAARMPQLASLMSDPIRAVDSGSTTETITNAKEAVLQSPSTDTPIESMPNATAQAAPTSIDDSKADDRNLPVNNGSSLQTSAELERNELERQQEIHEYVERIDALQAKLQYLSKEAAEAARTAAVSAPSGTMQKKLAQKDEQVALLMEEGQKLAKTEMKHLAIIKTLRAKNAEQEKQALEAKKTADKLEAENSTFAERLNRIDVIEKQSSDLEKRMVQMQKDLAAMTADRDAKNATIATLRGQLQETESQAKAEEVKAVTMQLEKERLRVNTLENDLSSLKIEKELAAGRARVQYDELKAKAERDAERARATELEMKAEQQMLEGRLEVLRTRAEEVSSGATGDAQAKLLRQIETLQSQSSIASENWQRIEASITSRATTLEKERDAAQQREAEVRRKAREINIKSKRTEDEADEIRSVLAELERELTELRDSIIVAEKRASKAEAALAEARAGFEQEKQSWTEMLPRIDEDAPTERFHVVSSRAESPIATHRSLTAEYLGLQNMQTRRSSARSINTEGIPPISRKSSSHLIKPASGRITPIRNNSQQSLFNSPEVGNHVPPSIVAIDQDDDFENLAAPSSPHDNKMTDLLSVSTIGAGPSVQLVERMSAAVRRLENEKVSFKEETARLVAQRDEARSEILELMNQIEVSKGLSGRVKELEGEVESVTSRYQTTLEMLGEKSELVEELRADVDDLKGMYRELVERTVR